MSSSVSSERAFSQGGITISKRRNRLKGDVVEALQCIKCMIRHDLLFQDAAPSSSLEAEEHNDELEGFPEEDLGNPETDVDTTSWDEVLIEEDEDEDEEDIIVWSE